MIQFNLIAPAELRDEIINSNRDKFKILTSAPLQKNHYFLIEADEADMIMFRLKYGNKNVWKR